MENLQKLKIQGTQEWALKTRKTAKDLVKTIDVSYFELARVLYEIQNTPADGDESSPVFQKFFKYSNFGDYVEDELGINRKKAERLVRIWKVVGVELWAVPKVVKDKLVSAGFSKLKELVRVLNVENAASWADKATEQTYQQLLVTIKKYVDYQAEQQVKLIQKKQEALQVLTKAKEDSTSVTPEDVAAAKVTLSLEEIPTETIDPATIHVEETVPWRMALYPDQHDALTNACKAAQKITGSNSRTHNLTMIALDFLSGQVGTKNIPEYLAHLEQVLGIKLIAFTHNGDPLYGIDSLAQVAANHEAKHSSN